MITIARTINAWRDSEQFEKPVESRSFMWHALIFPQYAFAIFAVPVYMILTNNVWYLLSIGILDIMASWVAFEYFLNKFRASY